jgi:hypothetical protein
MAFVPWSTVVAGAVATAAWANQNIRDNLNAWFPLASTAGVAYTAYTPTLTQSVTVTKTVTKGRYQQIGKTVFFEVVLAVTSSGTATNAVTIGLPVTAQSSNGQHCGTGRVFDTSAAATFPGLAIVASTTTCTLVDSTAGLTGNPTVLGQTGAAFAAAIASGDVVSVSGTYEAA